MKNVLVVGVNKTGTTIVATVIQNSITAARLHAEPTRLYMEPTSIAFFERCGRLDVPRVVKVLYEHWMQRPFLLTGIVRGETAFRTDKAVAIVRDPRDGVISSLMYGAYAHVLEGASKEQVDEWVEIVRDKERNPEKYSVIGMLDKLGQIFNARSSHGPDVFFENFIRYCAWIAGNGDYLHVLRYEDFVAGNTAELSAYLGLGLSTSREVDPGLQRVARTRRSGDWRRMMLPEDVAHWRARFGAALEAHGYGDWEIHPERSDPAGGSEYILRITAEAFRSREPGPGEPAIQPWAASGQLASFPIRRH